MPFGNPFVFLVPKTYNVTPARWLYTASSYARRQLKPMSRQLNDLDTSFSATSSQVAYSWISLMVSTHHQYVMCTIVSVACYCLIFIRRKHVYHLMWLHQNVTYVVNFQWDRVWGAKMQTSTKVWRLSRQSITPIPQPHSLLAALFPHYVIATICIWFG